MDEMAKLALERLKPRALELYHQQLSKRPTRDRYRKFFLNLYGPDRLQAMSDQQLLEMIPINIKNQGMDYTLEFKNDEEFRHSEFGSIAGGSAQKYGVFRRQAPGTGTWWTNEADPATDEQALAAVKQRTQEIAAACRFLDDLTGTLVADIDADEFQAGLAAAAPNGHKSVWLHCYLHIYCPRLVTWNHSVGRLEAELYRLGQPARYNKERYANDILALQFWSGLLGIPDLDVTPQWPQGARYAWTFTVENEQEARNLVERGILELGPEDSGDLGDIFNQKGTLKTQEQALHRLGLSKEQSANLKWLNCMDPGDLVCLVENSTTVLAVGEALDPPYTYQPRESKPHQRGVRWLHNHPFPLKQAVEPGLQYVHRKKSAPNIYLLEQSLLAYAGGEWPEVQPNLQLTQATRVVASLALNPPDDPITRDILQILQKKGQVILYGPPGTGKTYFASWAALEVVARKNFGLRREELTPADHQRAFKPTGDRVVPYISTCTFHPAYGYEDFIEGYRPTADGGFELRDGVFKRAARAAEADPDNHYILLIDEINRGNVPKILGELITLMEFNKREKLSVLLPLSGESFTVPRNLFVIATMNTADRSILLLDTALRRRFGFLELMPQPARLKSSPLERPNLGRWLAALNRRIVRTLGRDGRNLQVGHAYLMDDGRPIQTLERFVEALRQELWPLLQEYCYEDSQALAQILGNDLYDGERDDLNWQLFKPEKREELLLALEALIEPEDQEDVALDPEREDEIDDE